MTAKYARITVNLIYKDEDEMALRNLFYDVSDIAHESLTDVSCSMRTDLSEEEWME